jgi:hypothetical protein
VLARLLLLQPPQAALLDPPPFDPAKLSIEYLPGGREPRLASGRRYTLTHNDVTGTLQLSIGAQPQACLPSRASCLAGSAVLCRFLLAWPLVELALLDGRVPEALHAL